MNERNYYMQMFTLPCFILRIGYKYILCLKYSGSSRVSIAYSKRTKYAVPEEHRYSINIKANKEHQSTCVESFTLGRLMQGSLMNTPIQLSSLVLKICENILSLFMWKFRAQIRIYHPSFRLAAHFQRIRP